ncbi:PREDICTED: uncharacterized protein LOC104810448 [Tarenaya hassleriana]|uniref:uncharacterized protein LOC104810448 n=1 Tax=Tarenaya hassleriana TaxID=28532 RepID=UPI00053C9AE5|nr:PREDICTED: uncharacterized protein LOC104810448 [Tarenaya hassleriana]
MDLLRGVAQEGDSEKTTCSDLNGGVGQSRNLPLNYIPIGNPEEEEGYSLPTVGENVNDPRPWSGFLSDPSMNYPLFSGGLYYQLPFPVVGFPLVSCSPPSSSPSSLMGSSSKDPTPRSPLQTKSPDQKAGKKRPYPFFDSVISDSKEAKRMHRSGPDSGLVLFGLDNVAEIHKFGFCYEVISFNFSVAETVFRAQLQLQNRM